MALYPNARLMLRSPGRHFGPALGLEAKAKFRSDARNRFIGETFSAINGGLPAGYGGRGPLLPLKPGSLTGKARLTLAGSGAGVLGKNGSGIAALAIGAYGAGGLISSATGSASLTLAASGALFASKAVAGGAHLALNASGAITAPGTISGRASLALAAHGAPYAVGWLSGSTADAGLTPAGIANAVLGKVVEAGYSVEQILRILAAHAAGNASGLEGSNPQFIGLDGVTTRIDGSYTAGTRTIDALNGT